MARQGARRRPCGKRRTHASGAGASAVRMHERQRRRQQPPRCHFPARREQETRDWHQGGQRDRRRAFGRHSDGNAHAPEEERDLSMRGQLCGARESVRWSQLSPVAGRASSPAGCLRENTRDWRRESRIEHELRPGGRLGRRAPFTLEPSRSALFALARWSHDALQAIFMAQIACFSQPRRGPATHRNGDGDWSDYRRTVGPRLRIRCGASGHSEAHWWSRRK